jgi:hypothetical protein
LRFIQKPLKIGPLINIFVQNLDDPAFRKQ